MLPSPRAEGRSLARIVPGVLVVLVGTGWASAADWPQWLGPKRDAVWQESGTLDAFPEGGPKVVWRKPIGPGYTGPAVAGGKVYVMDRTMKAPVPEGKAQLGTLPGTERVLCLDLKTGAELWKHEYDCPYTGISYPQGPRTTPLVAGGTVYTLGTMGDLIAFDAANGSVKWKTNFTTDLKVKPPVWGHSAHLLLDGDTLITLVGGDGGAVRGFDAATGKEKWKGLSSQEVGYAPPVIADLAGKRQLVIWLSDKLAGLNPQTGEVYWQLKHPVLPEGKKQMRPAVTIVTPAVVDDKVLVSTYYEGCCAVKVTPTGADFAWKAKDVYPKTPEKLPTLMTTMLHRDGYLYGMDEAGRVVCLKAASGEKVWDDHALYDGKDTLFGTAFWVWNGNKVFAQTDLGDLFVLKPSPKGLQVLGKAHVIDATFSTRGRKVVWSHPAFADRCMVTRNDKEIVCVSLAK
ncbi:MAG: PQQ-binding-like beta-propeller repeat protein [Gemmataceae bacterium]